MIFPELAAPMNPAEEKFAELLLSNVIVFLTVNPLPAGRLAKPRGPPKLKAVPETGPLITIPSSMLFSAVPVKELNLNVL